MAKLYLNLLMLALVSLVAVLCRPLLPDRRLPISDLQYRSTNIFAEGQARDRANDTIQSNRARWTSDDFVECTIVAGTQPICGISIDLVPVDATLGIDLSRFTHLEFTVRSSSDLSQLRLTAVTLDESIFTATDRNSLTKSIYLIPKQFFSDTDITSKTVRHRALLSDFTVAEWWLEVYGLPDDSTNVNFGSLMALMLDLTPETPPGVYRFRFGELSFTGDYLPANQLYRMLAVIWLGIFFTIGVYLLYWNLFQQRQDRKMAHSLSARNQLLALRNDQIRKKAFTDSLTNTLNRKGLYNALKELAPDLDYAIILIDLDRFKQINDTFGHSAGDHVLRELAELLLLNSRKSDFVVRWGGEEFVIFCAGCNEAAAMSLAEKIRFSIATTEFHERLELTITASIGLAIQPAEPNSITNIAKVIEQADQSMYRAKAAGGNRVEIAELSTLNS